MPSKDEEQDAIEKSNDTLEKDKFKKLVYEPQGYVLQTVEEGTSGERVTIEVGPTDEEKIAEKVFVQESIIHGEHHHRVRSAETVRHCFRGGHVWIYTSG